MTGAVDTPSFPPPHILSAHLRLSSSKVSPGHSELLNFPSPSWGLWLCRSRPEHRCSLLGWSWFSAQPSANEGWELKDKCPRCAGSEAYATERLRGSQQRCAPGVCQVTLLMYLYMAFFFSQFLHWCLLAPFLKSTTCSFISGCAFQRTLRRHHIDINF